MVLRLQMFNLHEGSSNAGANKGKNRGKSSRESERELGAMIPEEVQLHPKDFTHMLLVVHAQGRYYYGIEPKEFFYGCLGERHLKEKKGLCRAGYKIHEACDHA